MKELKTDLAGKIAIWKQENEWNRMKQDQLEPISFEFKSRKMIERIYQNSLKKQKQKISGEVYCTDSEMKKSVLLIFSGVVTIALFSAGVKQWDLLDTYKRELRMQNIDKMEAELENKELPAMIMEDIDILTRIHQEVKVVEQELKEQNLLDSITNLVNDSSEPYTELELEGLFVLSPAEKIAVSNVVEETIENSEKGKSR